MIRNTFMALTLAFVLMGCDFNLNTGTGEEPTTLAEFDAQSESVTTLGVGTVCGDSAGTLCEAGLYCAYGEGNTGTCSVKEVDATITCDNEKAPVCGQKGRERLGYLNDCEMRRHGALLVNEGFCEVADVADNCAEKVYSVGNCGTRFDGVEFNGTTKNCESVSVRGCEVQTPFTDLQTCSTTCSE